MNQFLELQFLGNTMQAYAWVVGSLLVGALFQFFVSHKISDLVFKLIAKKDSAIDKDQLLSLIHI